MIGGGEGGRREGGAGGEGGGSGAEFLENPEVRGGGIVRLGTEINDHYPQGHGNASATPLGCEKALTEPHHP